MATKVNGKDQVTLTVDEIDEMIARATQAGIDRVVLALSGNATGVKVNHRAGKHTPMAVLDSKTGIAYHTRAAAGLAVAPEYVGNLLVHQKTKDGRPNTFVWFDLAGDGKKKVGVCPERFSDITQDEFLRVTAEADTLAKEIAAEGK